MAPFSSALSGGSGGRWPRGGVRAGSVCGAAHLRARTGGWHTLRLWTYLPTSVQPPPRLCPDCRLSPPAPRGPTHSSRNRCRIVSHARLRDARLNHAVSLRGESCLKRRGQPDQLSRRHILVARRCIRSVPSQSCIDHCQHCCRQWQRARSCTRRLSHETLRNTCGCFTSPDESAKPEHGISTADARDACLHSALPTNWRDRKSAPLHNTTDGAPPWQQHSSDAMMRLTSSGGVASLLKHPAWRG